MNLPEGLEIPPDCPMFVQGCNMPKGAGASGDWYFFLKSPPMLDNLEGNISWLVGADLKIVSDSERKAMCCVAAQYWRAAYRGHRYHVTNVSAQFANKCEAQADRWLEYGGFL